MAVFGPPFFISVPSEFDSSKVKVLFHNLTEVK
jgi:hypothetical protein